MASFKDDNGKLATIMEIEADQTSQTHSHKRPEVNSATSQLASFRGQKPKAKIHVVSKNVIDYQPQLFKEKERLELIRIQQEDKIWAAREAFLAGSKKKKPDAYTDSLDELTPQRDSEQEEVAVDIHSQSQIEEQIRINLSSEESHIEQDKFDNSAVFRADGVPILPGVIKTSAFKALVTYDVFLAYFQNEKYPAMLKEFEELGHNPLKLINQFQVRVDRKQYEKLVSIIRGTSVKSDFEDIVFQIVFKDNYLDDLQYEFYNQTVVVFSPHQHLKFIKYDSQGKEHGRLMPTFNLRCCPFNLKTFTYDVKFETTKRGHGIVERFAFSQTFEYTQEDELRSSNYTVYYNNRARGNILTMFDKDKTFVDQFQLDSGPSYIHQVLHSDGEFKLSHKTYGRRMKIQPPKVLEEDKIIESGLVRDFIIGKGVYRHDRAEGQGHAIEAIAFKLQ